MKNLTFKAAMLNDSRTTVNRRSTDGQSQRHYKQTPLSKRWKVLMTLVFLFTLAIGQMWATTAKQGTYYLQTPGAETPALTGDFYTTANLDQSQSCTYDAVNYTKAIKLGGAITAASGNNYPDRMIRYDCKTTATDFTFVVYNTKTTAYKYYISSVKENTLGEENAVSEFTSYDATNAKGVYSNTTAYSVTCTSATRASVYFTVGNNSLYIVQIIATEKGEDLLTPGTAGYAVNFNKGRLVARSGNAVTLDDFLEIHQNQNYAAGYTTYGKFGTNNTNYIKFAVPTQPIVLGLTTNNTKKYTVGAKGSTTNPITPTADKQQAIKITTTDALYINPQESSVQVTGMLFYIPEISYDKNNEDASGAMSSSTWTVADNGFTAPEGKKFDKWTKNADGTGGDVAVGDELLENTTLYAQWKDDVPVFSVTYDLNGATGTTPTETDKEENEVFTLHNGVTGITAPDTKVFGGWNDGTSTYAGGTEYTMGKDPVEFTAQWVNSYAVTYNKGANGTGSIEAGEKVEGLAYTLSSERFTRAGYVQVGWALADGGAKAYELGGSYTTDAAQEFFPVWAETSTYVAEFSYAAGTPAGWEFSNAGSYANNVATVDYVGAFANAATPETTPKGKKNDTDGNAATTDDDIAFSKNNDGYAIYDLGQTTTVTGLTAALVFGSSSAQTGTIEYLGADKSTVKKTISVSHLSGHNWGVDNVNETSVVTDVRYIKLKGNASVWIVMQAFSVTYVDLVTKYDVTFDKNDAGAGGTQTTLRYAEGAEVTLPGCTFTAPDDMEFDAWISDDVTISNNKFTMPGKDVVIKATWKSACALAPTVSATTLGTTSYTTQVVNCAGISVLGSAGCTISEYGFVYGTTTEPTISDNKKALTGDYTVINTAFAETTLTDLAANTKYYVRAYATNSFGTAYGEEISFTTQAPLGNVLVIAGSADHTSDAITAMRNAGFVVTVSAHDNERSYTGYDLVVLDESLGGGDAQTATNEESKIKDVNIPILNLKAFFYTLSSRWNWGSPVNGTGGNEIANIPTTYKNAQSHPIFEGLTITEGAIDLIDPAKTGNTLQGVTTNTLVEGKEGYTLATSGDGITFIHELTPAQRGVTDAKYLMIAFANNAKDNLSADGERLIVNAAKYLIGSTAWEPQYYTVSFEAHGDADPSPLTSKTITLPAATNGTASLLGWFTEETGGTKIGEAGESYTPTADITLHAQWETISTDARLASITFSSAAGTLSPAFDPEVVNYTYTMPYGTAAIPTITGATAVNANAQDPEIGDAAAAWGDAQTIKGVAQSGDKKTYTITMKVAPKDGVVIIHADIPSGTSVDYAATGLYAGTGTSKNEGSSLKLGTNHYAGVTLSGGETFKAGDILNVHVKTVNGFVKAPISTTNAVDESGVIFIEERSFVVGDNFITLTSAFEDANSSSLYLVRTTPVDAACNPAVDYIEVTRPMNPVLKKVTVNGVEGTPDALNAIAIEVPASTTQAQLEAIVYDWVSNSDAWTAAHTPAAANAWAFGVANTVTLTDKDGDQSVYTITVSKAEASHDATLSALSVDGYSLSPAFDPAVLTYNVELAKGTVIGDLPTVSYTLNHAGATAVKTNAAALPGATTIVVTAEDGLEENKKTYTINFTVSTKDKVVIFDGSTMDAVATSPGANGLSWELTGLSVSSKTIGSYTHVIATGGGTSNTKNIKISVPTKYEAQFEIGQATNSNGNERNALVKTTAKPGDSETLFTVSSSNASEAAVATSGALAGGKDYYLHSDNSINFVKIVAYLDRVSEAPAISAQPAALAVCDAASNTNALSVTASVEAGTLSYQWYKVVEEGDDVAVGTNSNEFVPTAVGEYYVVVTNVEGEYAPSSTKSEIATVSLKAQTEITGFENAAAPLNTEKTLSVTAAGTGTLTYKWQACTEAGVVTDENVLSSAATYGVTITEEPQYYLVTVEGECGSATQVLFAKKWADLELVDVEGSMTWNFAASNTGITEDVAVPSTMVLANAGQGAMPNTDNFHSDMLKAIVGSTGTAVRKSSTDGGCYQGTGIMFHTTVPGIVTVTYRGTGNSANVTLTVGSRTFDTYSGGFTTCDKVFVPAGDVEISSVGTMRIQKIVFNATPDYTRGVTEGRYGTICLPNGGIMVGAELYEVAYYDGTYEKIFLDEVLNGEMVAGRPYIFLTKEGVDKIAVFYTDEANAPEGDYHGLFGSYSKIHLAANDHIYILKDNRYYFVDSDNVYCGENRAYFKMGVADGISGSYVAPAPGRRRTSIGAGAPAVATGIENTGFESEAPRKVLINGELFIIRGEKMYDAKGQLVK